MKEMPQGIFNPFAPPKKKKPNIQTFEERRTESGVIIEPAVTFDGDSYVLKFEGTSDVKQAVEKLTNLLYAVNKIHGTALETNGVIVTQDMSPQPKEDEMSLTGPKCSIVVYVGEPPHKEVFAYRRIAHALKKLPIDEILTQHKATVSERG